MTPPRADPTTESDRFPAVSWASGETYGVGTVYDYDDPDPSRVWFTLTDGAITEPRFPRVDVLNMRTLSFVVTDGEGYVRRTHRSDQRVSDGLERTVTPTADDALAYEQRFEETADGRTWTLTVEPIVDPDNEALCARVRFDGDGDEYDVYVVGQPTPSSRGTCTRAERVGDDAYGLVAVDREGGSPVIHDGDGDPYHVALALEADGGFDWAAVREGGENGREPIAGAADAAASGEGVVSFGGRLGAGIADLETTIALGFATDGDVKTARSEATATLDRGFGICSKGYVESWQRYLEGIAVPDTVAEEPRRSQYAFAAMVIKAVEDKTFHGAGLASPSVPWGTGVDAVEAKDYGYNFVWSRDLYQVVTAFDAMGDRESAIDATEYLFTYQLEDGGFLPQNTYLEGTTRWGGEQLDNIAYPLVMAQQLAARHGYGLEEATYNYDDVRTIAEYILRSGPDSEQERWEEEAGYSPSTIAAEVTGLACAAVLADDVGEEDDALAFLATADAWAEAVESLTVTREGTPDLEPPYYVRVSRTEEPDEGNRRSLANGGPTLDERAIVDAGFLELVRLGIRSADDPVIERSVAVVDETIRVKTPHGPGWYRYVGDGYGERGEESGEEGAPWEGDGRGRLWPIFSGERAEYELRRGTEEGPLAPERLLRTMQRFANSGRMIPEQVWDREYGTEYGWEIGEGTGAATPLAWSMAGFVRLAHAIDAGEPPETPRFVRERYVESEEREPPALEVTVEATDGALEVSGTTDGDRLLVRVAGETHRVDPDEDGAFSFETGVGTDRAEVVVIAGSGAVPPDLATARVVRSVELD